MSSNENIPEIPDLVSKSNNRVSFTINASSRRRVLNRKKLTCSIFFKILLVFLGISELWNILLVYFIINPANYYEIIPSCIISFFATFVIIIIFFFERTKNQKHLLLTLTTGTFLKILICQIFVVFINEWIQLFLIVSSCFSIIGMFIMMISFIILYFKEIEKNSESEVNNLDENV